MRLLHRYILFELLRLFVYLLGVLTVLLLFLGVFREASESGLGPVQILRILPYLAPSLLPFTIPATLLLTVCVVYGRMAGDQEVVAAKAAGIPVLSVLTPALLLGGLLTVASFTLTNHVIPWAARNIQSVVARAVEDIFLDILSSRQQLNSAEQGYSITVTGVEGRRLINPTFKYAVNAQHTVVVANEATIKFDLAEQEVVVWFDRALLTMPGRSQETWLESFEIRLPLPAAEHKMKEQNLTIAEIQTKLAEVRGALKEAVDAGGADTGGADAEQLAADLKPLSRLRSMRWKLETELHNRFALAGGCFLFVLVGAPIAILRARQEFLTNFFVCFMPILLVYYPVALLMINLSRDGSTTAWWSAWIANALIATMGLFCLRRVTRR